MNELKAPPYAPSLIESMRSVGYSLESAIADLVDNSISAKADSVRIEFRPSGESYLAVIDNGEGMDADELTEAMRHGSKNPLEGRHEDDLGRFGLGLKTASLSQCKKMTVISLKRGSLCARCWDLDHVALREEWMLLVPDEDEILALPHACDLMELGHGTIVLWQSLDKLSAGELSVDSAFRYKMERVRQHLSLVFHRYIDGEPGLRRLQVSINALPIDPLDPFLTRNKATQMLPDSEFEIEGHSIWVRPFILPHISKLTQEDLVLAGGEESIRRSQGFYVYRNRRLIIWGTWFRLRRQEELSKLARVRVDIPNALDYLWTLDIKKSAAHPPEVIRSNLKTIVDRIADCSHRTYLFRGRKTRQEGMTATWDRVQGRGGSFSYRVNREHPVLIGLFESLNAEQVRCLENALELMEDTFPCDSLYADMASDQRPVPVDPGRDKLMELAIQIIEASEVVENGRRIALQSLPLVEPFCHHPEITNEIVKELESAL